LNNDQPIEEAKLQKLDLENLDPDSPEFLELVKNLSQLPQCAWAFKDLDESITSRIYKRTINKVRAMIPAMLELQRVNADPYKRVWLEKNLDGILRGGYPNTAGKDSNNGG